ncbi:MAG TPA: 50S ribosomal protein L29 [Candidatus Saccharimonadales bacterium]|nr:50S ribosomal protein L29 [Candidatus Saccharimonadales bacterium]
MAKKKDNKNNLVGKTKQELATMIADGRKELFNLRLDNSQRKLKNTSSLTMKRKEIARILTKIREIA